MTTYDDIHLCDIGVDEKLPPPPQSKQSTFSIATTEQLNEVD